MVQKRPSHGKEYVCFFVMFIFFILIRCIFPDEGFAVPAAPFNHVLKQSDGTLFKARPWGGESLHGWETEDGYSILFDKSTENWTYARHGVDGKLVKSSNVIGRHRPPADCIPHMRPKEEALSKIIRRKTSKEITHDEKNGRESLQESQPLQKVVPPTGTANIPVILINFNDTTTQYTSGDFNSLLFSSDNFSMADYYEQVSYGKFSVSAGPAGVLGWYTASHTHDYYGENDNTPLQYDVLPGDLVYEAVEAADSVVDFSRYDSDGDGYVDVVNIIHQGTGEEQGINDADIWSHRWSLSSAKMFGYSNFGEYTTNDRNTKGNFVKIDDYLMQPELLIIPEFGFQGQSTVGVFVHEYGHALGLPDLYDTDFSSEGIGDWSLMAGGSWTYKDIPGDRPSFMDAWCRYFLEWVDPLEVTDTLTNETITQATTADDVYQLLSGEPLSGEYFLVENRQQVGFDIGLPGTGLLIWHIDGNVIARTNELNEVNTKECYPPNSCAQNHYGVALVQADGSWDMEKGTNRGDASDSFPGLKGNTSFTNNTSPGSNLYSGANSKVSITDISEFVEIVTATLSVEDGNGTQPTPSPTPGTNNGRIFGTVVDKKSGNTIKSAKVILKSREKGIKEKIFTDDEGFFEFTNLESGKYKVKANKRLYRRDIEKVTLTDGQSQMVVLKLKKK